MKIKACIILLVISFLAVSKLALAQHPPVKQEISFLQDMNWEEIKAKAKKENKYIFVDCFTTWCTPCKQMDMHTYTDKKVADFFNERFVSVKVQMDKTAKDNETVRSWHQEANNIAKNYAVNLYPTFLFFAPDGKIVHRKSGFFNANQFINIGKDAMDSSKQYYTFLSTYNPGQLDTAALKKLAIEWKESGPELSGRIVNDYFSRIDSTAWWTDTNISFLTTVWNVPEAKEIAQKYITKLKQDQIYNSITIVFLINFVNRTKDKGFTLLYANPGKVDSVMNSPSWSTKNYLASIILKDKGAPIMESFEQKKKKPDWNLLFNAIQKDFGSDYAYRVIGFEKMSWYQATNDSTMYVKSTLEYLNRFGKELDDFNLNNYAWDIFLNSNDKAALEEALKWSNKAVCLSPDPNWMDTYANLLYKLGRRKEAIAWEEVSTKLEPQNKNFENNLNKMMAGKPTWTN